MGNREELAREGLMEQVELLRVLAERPDLYQCPGESLAINSAVHQARLRAHYPKCRQCPHREDASLMSRQQITELWESWGVHNSGPRVLLDGFRGILWNEMTHRDVRRICAAYCQQLRDNWLSQQGGSPHQANVLLVMGHDSRVSSLEVLDVAIRAVREQGCRVIDVGEVSGPCLRFVVDTLEADGGIHATSAGADRTVIGLDILGRGGIPLSGESLHVLHSATSGSDEGRCGRNSGDLSPFPARKAYLGSLWKHFRDLPAATIRVACPNDFARHVLADLAEELPLRLIPLPWSGDLADEAGGLLQEQLQAEIRELGADLGLLLGEDGQACEFFDASGRKLAPREVLTVLLISESCRGESVGLLLGEEFEHAGEAWWEALPVSVRFRQSLRENFALGMKTSQARIGLDGHSRYWFRGEDGVAICDGLLTLARVLQGLS